MRDFKYVRDFTYDDFSAYANKRACDGNWGTQLALICLEFGKSIPLFRKNKYVKNHIGDVFNLKNYPNMQIDIETGEIMLDDGTIVHKVVEE